ncbi:MAG: histidinol-phosphate transaminase [Candidatus Sedimenticola sp. 20ELBAFRAG]
MKLVILAQDPMDRGRQCGAGSQSRCQNPFSVRCILDSGIRRNDEDIFTDSQQQRTNTMSRYWSKIVHQLTPYVPGEQPKMNDLIKLNTNENPYGPSPRALEALRAEADDTLRLYPDPNADRLKEAVADYYGVTTAEVFVGNGSDEVLAHSFQALLKQELPLLYPDITYSFYPVYSGLYAVTSETIALNENFEIDVDDYARPNGGIIFPNPNAPTGQLLPLESIEKLLKANPDSVVVIDEAYIDFGGESAIALVGSYPNLLVIQTLSKSRSLAGLRTGFAVGHPELIEALERVKNSFNSYPLDRFAIAGAVAAMEDKAYFEQTCARIIATREKMTAGLEAAGFEVMPSAANFVFARHPERDAAEISSQLRERSIIVRHFRQPRIDQYLRITVGTDGECEKLIEALAGILG